MEGSKPTSDAQIENLSILIHTCMTQRRRRYHSLPHVFEIGKGAPRLEQLAILFHDIIYFPVDKKIHPILKPYLKNIEIAEKTFHITLPDPKTSDQPQLLQLTYQIFGLSSGQTLVATSGENEFLSALLAARVLEPHLDTWDLVSVLAGIEATIPFRSLNAHGLNPPEALAQRLKSLNTSLNLGKTQNEIDAVVQVAVNVANRDVKGFASDDPGHFLSQTWELILEGNPIFRDPLYTIFQYRVALQKMEGFFSSLKTGVIFRQYFNHPDPETYDLMIKKAQSNLATGVNYIQVQLLALSIFEALALLSGGDCPLVLFRGEIPSETHFKSSRLGLYLDSTIPIAPNSAQHPMVLKLLVHGRKSPDGFDFLHSTLGAYLYERLSEKDLQFFIQKSKNLFSGQLSPVEFLKLFPRTLMHKIIEAAINLAWSRKTQLSSLLTLFSHH
ncbi:MAG: hypothetical protein ACO3A2_05550 [Bdellovibrionia bacterium]